MLKDKLKGKLKLNLGLKSYILIGVCIALVIVDLLTKIFEERYGWNFTVIPGFIEVESGSRNPGCAFSFLADAAWGQTFLIVMTFIILAALVAVFVFLPEKYTLLKVALALIVSGAIGNLIDRIAYREVRDFVEMRMFGRMVSCNFADFWIVIGTVVAIVDMLFINDWSLFPLTKKAKEAQSERRKECENSTNTLTPVPEESDIKSDAEPADTQTSYNKWEESNSSEADSAESENSENSPAKKSTEAEKACGGSHNAVGGTDQDGHNG